MGDPKSRARVQRLLSGDFCPDDLTGLFLYARDHCDGREPVAEIGHFVAHHSERDMGISQSAIARLENGHTLPGIKTLLRYAEATSSKLQVRLSAA
jgi:hypothetical protein